MGNRRLACCAGTGSGGLTGRAGGDRRLVVSQPCTARTWGGAGCSTVALVASSAGSCSLMLLWHARCNHRRVGRRQCRQRSLASAADLGPFSGMWCFPASGRVSEAGGWEGHGRGALQEGCLEGSAGGAAGGRWEGGGGGGRRSSKERYVLIPYGIFFHIQLFKCNVQHPSSSCPNI